MKTTLPILSPQKVAAEIKKRNDKFKKATKAGKRVLICQDVIAQIKAQKIKPISGHWFKNTGLETEFDSEKSLQELILSNEIPQCQACGVGSMMIACTLYKNKEKIKDIEEDFTNLDDFISRWENTEDTNNGFVSLFGERQLKLIEIAFEGGNGRYGSYSFDEDGMESSSYVDAKTYYKKYRKHSTRLIKIMENIIENKGSFIP